MWTALMRPELIKAVVEAVKAQTQSPLVSAGSKDATQGTSANAGEPHVKTKDGMPSSLAHHFCLMCTGLPHLCSGRGEWGIQLISA